MKEKIIVISGSIAVAAVIFLLVTSLPLFQHHYYPPEHYLEEAERHEEYFGTVDESNAALCTFFNVNENTEKVIINISCNKTVEVIVTSSLNEEVWHSSALSQNHTINLNSTHFSVYGQWTVTVKVYENVPVSYEIVIDKY